MAIKCDVLVVGAGPAGLATAYITSQKGLNTIVIEKNSEIGHPVKSSALTWKDVIDEWKISKNSICQWYDIFEIKSLDSGKRATIPFNDKICCTLNFSNFLRELFDKNVKMGTKFIISKTVKEPIFNNGKIEGIILDDGEEIYAKIVVDASGPEAIIGRKINPMLNNQEIGVGLEYEFTNCKIKNPKKFDIFVGYEKVIPVGYGWVFPLSKTCCRVGVATSFVQGKGTKINITKYLENFLLQPEILSIIKNAQAIEKHSGTYPVGGMLKKVYDENLLIVGDAAAQANPLFGEGIRYALNFGKIAGISASKSIALGNTSKAQLKNYEKYCKKMIGDSFEAIVDYNRIPTNIFWDEFISTLEYIWKIKGKNEIVKIIRNELPKREIQKLFIEKGRYV